MKKWIWGCVVAAVIVGAIWFYQNCYLPEFEIVSTIKTGCDDYTSVYLTVAVNQWFYNKTYIIQKVREYYCDLNDEPDEIKLKLCNNNICFK